MGQKMNVMDISDDFPILQQLKQENSAFIPDSFYKSLQRFCIRNVIEVKIHDFAKTKVIKEVCPQCLKAFILNEAITKYHMSIDLISLSLGINASLGHFNYYTDNGELKKI